MFGRKRRDLETEGVIWRPVRAYAGGEERTTAALVRREYIRMRAVVVAPK